MPKMVVATPMFIFSLFIGIVLLTSGTIILGVLVTQLRTAASDQNIATETNEAYTMVPRVIGTVCIIGGILIPILWFVLEAVRKDPNLNTYVWEEADRRNRRF